MPQLIDIDNIWNGVRFCCPACGAEIFTLDGEPTPKPCEHLLFSWISEIGEFYNASPAVQRLADMAEACDEMLPSPFDKELTMCCPTMRFSSR